MSERWIAGINASVARKQASLCTASAATAPESPCRCRHTPGCVCFEVRPLPQGWRERSGGLMNLEKVVFGFFIVLAATLNFGFFIGEIDQPRHHHVYELFAAIVVNLIATVLKFGDRTQIGAVHLSTSLVADLQLVAAAGVWAIAVHVTGEGMSADVTTSVVSLSGGALFANVVSVVLLIAETVMLRR
jgi:hypothetical protein